MELPRNYSTKSVAKPVDYFKMPYSIRSGSTTATKG